MNTTTRVSLSSGDIHVESNGDPDGRLVLCVHGLSANCRSFERLMPALAAAGHHVVTMDLRGRGRSEMSPPGTYGWHSHVRDLLEIADIYGADSVDVVGHSMGGFVGMTLAADNRRRCRRLVLIDAVGRPEPDALRSIAHSVSRLGRTYPSKAAALSHVRSVGPIAAWNTFWDKYFEWDLQPDGESAVRFGTDLAAVGEDSADAARHDVYGLWPRIECPVLLVRAQRPLAPDGGFVVSAQDAERFAAENRNATVVDVDSDHYTVLIDPVAIATIERFLRT